MKKKSLFLLSSIALLGVASLASCKAKTNNNDDTKESTVQTTGKTYQELLDENEDLQNQLQDLENESNSKDETIAELERSNEEVRNELTRAGEEKADLEQTIANLNERIDLFKKNKYAIRYVDYLGNKTTYEFDATDSSNVVADLNSKFKTDIKDGTYGKYINGINDSFIDPNWSIMIYENFVTTNTGIEGLAVDPGDVFEFKHECWNSVYTGYGKYDEYDVLVDKAVYNYLNTRLKNNLLDSTTWTGSTYWDCLIYYHLHEAEYPAYFDINQDFYNSLADANQADLPNATEYASVNNYFKFYYGARLYPSINIEDFKSSVNDYFIEYPAPAEYSEYTFPFMISMAKSLELDGDFTNLDKYKEYLPKADQWGPDGICWMYTGLASVEDITDKLSNLKYEYLENSLSKDVSLSSYLLPYAACNANPRQTSEDKDLIQILFDEYFDESTMKFTTEASASDYSSNQIYAALVAYKISRDLNKACNLFE